MGKKVAVGGEGCGLICGFALVGLRLTCGEGCFQPEGLDAMTAQADAGLFLSFEGLEASGKSTQIGILAEGLRKEGRRVVLLREPGGTPVGERIRHLLQHDEAGADMCAEAEALLFCASRAQLVRRVILPALALGSVVLCDRFSDSTTAYQGAARRLDGEMVRRLNEFATGGLKPHRTFLLDLPAEEAVARLAQRAGKADRLEREDLAFHQAVREAYLAIAGREPERVTVLDGREPRERLHDRIRQILKESYGLFA